MKKVSVGEVLAGMLAPPIGDGIRLMGIRVLRMNDSPASSIACFAL